MGQSVRNHDAHRVAFYFDCAPPHCHCQQRVALFHRRAQRLGWMGMVVTTHENYLAFTSRALDADQRTRELLAAFATDMCWEGSKSPLLVLSARRLSHRRAGPFSGPVSCVTRSGDTGG